MNDTRRENPILVIGILLAALTALCSGCAQDTPRELILYDFESDAELDQLHWSCGTLYSLSTEHATRGSKSLKMELFPADYPGLTPALKKKDWHAYHELSFDIYNASATALLLGVRIDDKKDYPGHGDRFNKGLLLHPGMNHVSIPFGSLMTSGSGRMLNTASLERLFLFAPHPKTRIILYIDAIRLLKVQGDSGTARSTGRFDAPAGLHGKGGE